MNCEKCGREHAEGQPCPVQAAVPSDSGAEKARREPGPPDGKGPGQALLPRRVPLEGWLLALFAWGAYYVATALLDLVRGGSGLTAVPDGGATLFVSVMFFFPMAVLAAALVLLYLRKPVFRVAYLFFAVSKLAQVLIYLFNTNWAGLALPYTVYNIGERVFQVLVLVASSLYLLNAKRVVQTVGTGDGTPPAGSPASLPAAHLEQYGSAPYFVLNGEGKVKLGGPLTVFCVLVPLAGCALYYGVAFSPGNAFLAHGSMIYLLAVGILSQLSSALCAVTLALVYARKLLFQAVYLVQAASGLVAVILLLWHRINVYGGNAFLWALLVLYSIVPLAWTVYFMRSKRVRATFPKG